MSGESFNAITKGLFDPVEQARQAAIMRWTEAGLHRRFSMLEADSAIVEKGLQLYDERKQANSDYRAMDKRFKENSPDDDPHWLLAETSRLQFEDRHSVIRWALFGGLYSTIQTEILDLPTQEPADYDDIISQACADRAAEIERDPYRLKALKDDLLSLTYELGMLYRLEPDRHFISILSGDHEF